MRKFFYLLLLLVFAAGVKAQQLTESQAKQRALEFLNKGDRAKGTKFTASRLKNAEMPLANIFSFNVDGGGFVVVSGDSRTLPVLGYSNHGTIDYDKMPDNMRGWLKGYEQAIASLGDAAVEPQERVLAERQTIEPFMLDEYTYNGYSEEQLQAVAYLMRYCGQSVRMGYSPYVSYAYANDVAAYSSMASAA